MRNNLLILLTVGLLSACATSHPPTIQTVIQRVEVPISVTCKAIVPPAPVLNFDKATPEQDIFDKTKALLADRKLQLAHEAELEAALNSCIK